MSFLDKPKYAWCITSLILYSVVCFSIETLPNLTPDQKSFLRYSEIVVVAIFTLEYLIRVFTADRKLQFVFSFYGVIDLLAILPFYLAFAVDLRAMRMVRFFRLVRLLKLARYNRAMTRFLKALYLAKEELVLFLGLSLILIYLSAVAIYHFENPVQPEVFRSIFDCIWWAVATLTTVGYGDIYPVTVGGRLFTFVILLIGLGLVSVPAGIIASALSEVRGKRNDNAA